MVEQQQPPPPQPQPQQQQIKINFPPHLAGGAYANNLIVTHSQEEFTLDFIMVVPPAAAVTARVVVTPGNMKRMSTALQENLKKYEEKFGEVRRAEEPKAKIGFHP